MQCSHVDTNITDGKFKVGDRVTREIRFKNNDNTQWGDSLLMSGTVIRAYSRAGCLCGPYSELYDVCWDAPFAVYREDGDQMYSTDYLPHGLDPENVFKATYWILHPELL